MRRAGSAEIGGEYLERRTTQAPRAESKQKALAPSHANSSMSKAYMLGADSFLKGAQLVVSSMGRS